MDAAFVCHQRIGIGNILPPQQLPLPLSPCILERLSTDSKSPNRRSSLKRYNLRQVSPSTSRYLGETILNLFSLKLLISPRDMKLQRRHTAQKWTLLLRIYSVNVTKSEGNWIWSHLLKKSLMENFIFCAVIQGSLNWFPLSIDLLVPILRESVYHCMQSKYQNILTR